MLILGDCLEKLKEMPDCLIDSLITDPPAGIGFMNKEWDRDKGGRTAWIAWLEEIAVECLRVLKPGAHGLVWALPRTSHWTAMALDNAGFEIRDIVHHLFGSGFPKSLNIEKAGAGKQWQGFGTALKPAAEHWVLIRKPLGEKTVAKNVLKHGCGGLNIDASRIEGIPRNTGYKEPGTPYANSGEWNQRYSSIRRATDQTKGRFPSHVILSEDAAEEVGDPSRFFYIAKASAKDKGPENTHPTVKNTKLMEYLIRLITPPAGMVLDPFMGSGSTGVAAKRLGFGFVGIEKSEEYFEIASNRFKD